jgi:transposase
MTQEGHIIHHGRVTTTPDAIREIFAPADGQAQVALESTGAWSYVYDLLKPLGVHITLAHPRRVKAIAFAKVKTDSVDATTLAHLLRTGLLPTSFAPSPQVRTCRELLRTRQGLVRMRTACCLRIHALLTKEGRVPPVSDLFGRRGRCWLSEQALSPSHRYLVDILLAQADSLTQGIRALESRLRCEFEGHPALFSLQRIPGFGFLTAAAFLAEVGEISRFPRARYLVSYLGLAPRVHASGQRVRIGKLTKEGPSLMRSYLVQAVQRAIRRPGPCQELYQRVRQRSGAQTARVAVARKLAIMAYHAWKSPEEVS